MGFTAKSAILKENSHTTRLDHGPRFISKAKPKANETKDSIKQQTANDCFIFSTVIRTKDKNVKVNYHPGTDISRNLDQKKPQ